MLQSLLSSTTGSVLSASGVIDIVSNVIDTSNGAAISISNSFLGRLDSNTITKNETFPAVSLSVKNPVSSKVLILLVTLQILSNIGILYFLYLGMEY